MPKKVAIIGGGCSGLLAIKCCLDEGLEPVCFESTEDIGGLWRFTEELRDDRGCVMKSTVINTSKEMMCFSDFPIPADFANYMHNSKVWEYFNMYAKHFGLLKYIHLNTEVLAVTPVEKLAETGQWMVETKKRETNDISTEVFDAVMLCTGHHTRKKIPKFEGMDEFEGRIVHPHDYRNHKELDDKRVIVVGIGNSGADVIVEAGRIGKQAFLSTRRGAWVLNRVQPSGYPFDVELNSRLLTLIFSSIPRPIRLWILERKNQQLFNHDLLGIKPKHRWDAAHPLVCDELANRISCGSVVIKPDIKRLTKTGVEFEDGTFEDNIDVIVCATGYEFNFDYVKHPGLVVKKNVANLFKYVFPPDIRPGTLAVIGLIQPWGAILPMSELQCRWAARVFKEEAFLPDPSIMWEDVRAKQADMAARYVESTRHTIQVDWIPYMDELADQVGCKPNFKRLLFEDPRLALECFIGPCTPYQFRLDGPGRWEGAREAILTQWDRIHKPFKTRPLKSENGNINMFYHIILLIVILGFFRWLLY